MEGIKTTIEEQIEVENKICTCEQISKEEFQQIQKKFNKKWLQLLISFAGYIKIFSYKYLGDLFEATGNPIIEFSSNHCFSHYLLARGLISEKNFNKDGPPQSKFIKSADDYENPIKTDTIWYYIYKDEITQFVNMMTVKNISIEKERVWFNGVRYYIPGFSCYCNSMSILKYLVVNGVTIDMWAIQNAVEGGSEEVIQFLESKGYSMNKTLRTAIGYHHNQIAKWLVSYYKDIFFVFPDCVQAFNTEMLVFFLQECSRDVNEKGVWEKSALHYAVEHNDLVVAKYLLSKRADKTVMDESGKKPIDYIDNSEMRAVFALYG